MVPRLKVPRFRSLLACALMVVVLATLARGLAAWKLRAYSIDLASRDVGHIAAILAATTEQSVNALDRSLALLQQQVIDRQAAGDPHRIAPADPDLDAERAHLPPAADFAIVDAQGHVVERSPSWPDAEGAVIFASRPGSDSLRIGPAENRQGAKTLLFSRPVETRQGEFLGMAAIRVSARYFKPAYDADGAMENVAFTLLSNDGTVLVQAPDHAGEKMPPQSPWYATLARGGGVYSSSDDPDQQTRFVAVRAVPNYPLVVDASELEQAVMAPWQRLAAMIAGATLLSFICFTVLLWTLRLQFRKLSAAQISLAERESELASAHTQIDAALNNMSQGLCMFDKDARLVVRNERYLRIYGMLPDAARPGASLVDLLAQRQRAGNFSGDPQKFADDLRARLARGETVSTTHELADGRIIEVVNEPMPGGGWVATHDDITERQRSEARIARMARYDSLTDLANRALFREKADAALARYRETGIGYSIFIFDLDLFKSVNDSLGHPVGDALLKAVATRLTGLVSEADTIGRLGGDEFGILHVAAGDQREGAANLAKRLLAVIGAPFEIDGNHIVIGTSVGIAMAPHHGTDNEKLLKNADLALYRAKSDGRNSYRFFEQEMDREVQLRRTLEVDLNRAVANSEFEAYYQPVVDAGSAGICAVEALIRWQHPRHGVVGPTRFIPVAEERGLITAIDRWMLQRACRDAMAWPTHIRVAVNLSPIDFRSGDLIEMIKDALARSGLPAARLELEITESVLLQKSARNLAILHQIKQLGASIVLDDFGTGYSSLGYLRLFPFDKIKIDQSFVREMPDRADCAAIVCAIANLGRELDMVTVAEGVETSEQLELVRAAGCKQAQGFLFSGPVPASRLRFDEPRLAASA
jgi:diguanylate cyclase (GGDEF)-like protein